MGKKKGLFAKDNRKAIYTHFGTYLIGVISGLSVWMITGVLEEEKGAVTVDPTIITGDSNCLSKMKVRGSFNQFIEVENITLQYNSCAPTETPPQEMPSLP